MRIEIFIYLRPLINMPDIKGLSKDEKNNMSEKRIIEEEYKWFFETK